MKLSCSLSHVVVGLVLFAAGSAAAQEADGAARCGELPAAVADMYERILATAQSGSLEDLAALGDEGTFTASYGGGDTAEVWQSFAADGIDMRAVAKTLLGLGCSVSASDDLAYFTWPAAVDLPYDDLTDEERRVLAELHGAALETLYVEGTEVGYYVGWTLMIDETGDWIALVAGD